MSSRPTILSISVIAALVFCSGCAKESGNGSAPPPADSAIRAVFKGSIDLNNLEHYADQSIPQYIKRDNTSLNPITDKGATLGRVLFYDKNLSINNTTACASCHKQAFAFGDTAIVSKGANGATIRHSMRLINTRFAEESKFFWNERAASLEDQTSMPIQDHNEMGYSGQNGDPPIADLIAKLNTISYYKELFQFVYGSGEVTEERLRFALAQFIRSIQSFDSKYDEGRAQVGADSVDFPNFTVQENLGKNLFLGLPIFGGAAIGNVNVRSGGGLGCAQCHRAPEFDIDPGSLNNSITKRYDGGRDYDVTRAPSLRDLLHDGRPNGPFMHSGEFSGLRAAVGHYNVIVIGMNTNLDPRLMPGGEGQRLRISAKESDAIEAFLNTLSGSNVYTDKKWSNPFP